MNQIPRESARRHHLKFKNSFIYIYIYDIYDFAIIYIYIYIYMILRLCRIE